MQEPDSLMQEEMGQTDIFVLPDGPGPRGQASEEGGPGVTAGPKLVLQPCPSAIFSLTNTDHPSINSLPPTLHSLLERSFVPFVTLQMETVL